MLFPAVAVAGFGTWRVRIWVAVRHY
jgi:hypothetical protein